MSFLLAIEGADGAGKATTAGEVVRLLREKGRTAEVITFPRYTDTVGGHVLGDFLAGRLPHTMSPRALATLYALDRFESRELVLETAARCDVVVFDRYIASNMAYQAAKVATSEAEELMRWIVSIETAQFAMPAPDLSIYLDTPLDVARAQIARKQQRSYTEQTYDAHEADDGLQMRVRAAYAALVDSDLLGAWQRVITGRDGTMRAPGEIAAEIVAALGSN
jgi:dTMP kinase